VSKTKKDIEKFRFKDFGKKSKQRYSRDKNKEDWKKLVNDELQTIDEKKGRAI